MSSTSRKDKLRQKRLQRKERRKSILDGVQTIVTRPDGLKGVSVNWETLKSVMGIKENMNDKAIKAKKLTEERQKKNTELTKVIALDCEMVGVGPGGRDNMLARVSIVNLHGNVVYDKHVLPVEPIVDYRTQISGITPEDVKNGVELAVVQKEIAEIFKDRILVGHAIRHDFKVLFLSHPSRFIRDTSLYKPYREMFGGRTPSLKNLALRVLDLNIQQGEHNPVQDAQVAMKLYLHFRRQWEDELKKRYNRIKRKEQKRKEKADSRKDAQSSETEVVTV